MTTLQRHTAMTEAGAGTMTIGVLALQGAFSEHIQLLRRAFVALGNPSEWSCIEVRTAEQLARCTGLIIPGGESTTIALVASRSNLLEPLRDFVKVQRRPVWGTCAGMILLAEAANQTKKGGQELIGGLDVRVNRNYFGRQVESFETNLQLSFLSSTETSSAPFRAVFIRAPVVEKLLTVREGAQVDELKQPETVIAPSKTADLSAAGLVNAPVEVLAHLPPRQAAGVKEEPNPKPDGDIIAIRQGNVFATSFHPELTDDARIHIWWLRQITQR